MAVREQKSQQPQDSVFRLFGGVFTKLPSRASVVRKGKASPFLDTLYRTSSHQIIKISFSFLTFDILLRSKPSTKAITPITLLCRIRHVLFTSQALVRDPLLLLLLKKEREYSSFIPLAKIPCVVPLAARHVHKRLLSVSEGFNIEGDEKKGRNKSEDISSFYHLAVCSPRPFITGSDKSKRRIPNRDSQFQDGQSTFTTYLFRFSSTTSVVVAAVYYCQQ